MTLTISDRIRRAYSLYTHVSSYGVDGANLDLPTELAARIDLHPTTFFSKVYVARPGDEEYIRGFLESGAMSLWIKGSVGVGKSTVVHKAVRDYNEVYELPFIYIDFRVDDLKVEEPAKLDAAIRAFLQRRVFDYLRAKGITRDQLALAFCDKRYDRLLSAGAPQDCFQALLERFTTVTGGSTLGAPSFPDWVREQRFAGANGYDSFGAGCLRQLAEALTLSDQLFAICNLVPRREPRRVAIFFDNLDSILDITLRSALKQWLKTHAESFKRVAYFVSCVRPENEAHFVDANDLQTAERATFNEGASVSMTISLDPGELNAEDLREYERSQGNSYFDPEDDLFSDPVPDTPVGRRRAFDDAVHWKRLHFLATLAEGKPIEGIEKQDIEVTASAFREILLNRPVNRDIQMLANGNRRDMLAGVANFLEYLVRDLRLEWDLIGRVESDTDREQRARRGTAIKSLYYQWVASGRPGEEQPPVFEVDSFNPVEWVEAAGWQGDQLCDSTSACGASSLVSALGDFFVLTATYTLSGNTVSEKYRHMVQVSRVITTCRSIGLSADDVVNRLNRIVRAGRVRYHGLLETTRFVTIYSGTDGLNERDGVHITDRGCRLLEQTGVMFNFLAELVRRRRQCQTGNVPRSQDSYRRGVIDLESAAETVAWIRRALTTELRVMELFRRELENRESKKDWRERYAERFCIRLSHRPGTDQAVLFSHRIVRSSVAYLEHVARLVKRDEQREFERLVRELRQLDSMVQELLINGRLDLVPRDRPLKPLGPVGR